MSIPFKEARAENFRAASRRPSDICYLVIHFTANDGDSAKNNADYFAREAPGASAHFFVDEREIWQSVQEKDIAWHCGTRGMYFHPYCRNANSLGVELCSRKRGEKYYFTPETVKNAQQFVRSHPDGERRAALRRHTQKLPRAVCRGRGRVAEIQGRSDGTGKGG